LDFVVGARLYESALGYIYIFLFDNLNPPKYII
jgi:hypothetical protein